GAEELRSVGKYFSIVEGISESCNWPLSPAPRSPIVCISPHADNQNMINVQQYARGRWLPVFGYSLSDELETDGYTFLAYIANRGAYEWVEYAAAIHGETALPAAEVAYDGDVPQTDPLLTQGFMQLFLVFRCSEKERCPMDVQHRIEGGCVKQWRSNSVPGDKMCRVVQNDKSRFWEIRDPLMGDDLRMGFTQRGSRVTCTVNLPADFAKRTEKSCVHHP